MLRETDSIHVYVMTSPDNDEETRRKFRDNLNFGLWKKNIHFFCQDSIPATDEQGKILMADRLKIFMAPNGNGGMYDAIEKAGLVNEWKKKGIDYVHVMGVDNLMAKPVDPVLIGMMKGVKGEFGGLDLVAQYVKPIKDSKGKEESVGRICFKNNLPSVVEYTDLKDDTAKYQMGFTASFGISVDQIQTCIDYKDAWEVFHLAKKKMNVYYPPSDREVATTLAKANGTELEEAL